MSDLTHIRNKIQKGVFDRLGTTAELLTTSSVATSYGGYTSGAISITSTQDITVALYSSYPERNAYQPFGNITAGDFIVLMPYTLEDSVSKGTHIRYDSVTYTVHEIEKYIIDNGTVLVAARCTRDAEQLA